MLGGIVALSLQLEAGVTVMQKPPDDIYVEYALPNANAAVRYTTATFGAALRFDTKRLQFAIGWRNLGDQHIAANIIADADYFACRGSGHCSSNYTARWYSTGNEQQVYAELGYKFQLGRWVLLPAAGLSDNILNWHVNAVTDCLSRSKGNFIGPTEHQIAPFVGLNLERGHVGVGAYLLQTHVGFEDPMGSPGQGTTAAYFRITYRIGE